MLGKKAPLLTPNLASIAIQSIAPDDEQALKARQSDISTLRRSLAKKIKVNAERMENRLRRNRKNIVNFEKDNLVTFLVPKIDRASTDSTRIPDQIFGIKKKNYFTILSDFGRV